MESAKNYFISSVTVTAEKDDLDLRLVAPFSVPPLSNILLLLVSHLSCRDPIIAAGLRARELMTSDPGSEEDIRKKFSSLPPPDSMYTLGTLYILTTNLKGNLCIILKVLRDQGRTGALRLYDGFLLYYISTTDDEWMEVTPSELDEMMRRAAGYLPSAGGGDGGGGGERRREEVVSNMVQGVKSFVDTISSHEGAEFPR